jgi:fucose permease
MFAYAITLSVGPASTDAMSKNFGIGGKELAALFFLQSFGFLAAVALGTYFARFFGKQASVALGCLFMTAGCLLVAIVPQYALVLPSILLVGFGGGFAEPMAMALVSDVYSGSKRTAMMNYTQVAFGVGAVGAPLLVGWALSQGINWRLGFFTASGVSLAALLVCLIGIKAPSKIIPQAHREKLPLTNPILLALCAGMFLYVGAELGAANWLTKYFAEDLKAGVGLAAWTVSIFWGGVTVGRFLAGILSKHFADVVIIRFSLLSALMFQIALVSSHSPVVGAFMVALLGLSMAAIWPTILAYAGGIFNEHIESAFSVIVAAGSLGSVLIPPIVGAVSDVIGWRSALTICPMLGFTNIILFTFVACRAAGR